LSVCPGPYTAGMNSSSQRVRIDLGTRSYDIVIGCDLIGHAETWTGLPRDDAVIVTNTTVGPLSQ